MSQKPNFSHLRNLTVATDSQSEFIFYGISGEPALDVAPATEANKPYLNGVLARSKKLARRLRGARMTVEVLQESREQDRELYPKHVVKGWRNVFDADGNEVPFCPEACAEFLQAIPNDMFDELRTFCGNADNFRHPDEGDEEDAEELAGN
jgi:hypothetical protein